jgi:hypothetical protein
VPLLCCGAAALLYALQHKLACYLRNETSYVNSRSTAAQAAARRVVCGGEFGFQCSEAVVSPCEGVLYDQHQQRSKQGGPGL